MRIVHVALSIAAAAALAGCASSPAAPSAKSSQATPPSTEVASASPSDTQTATTSGDFASCVSDSGIGALVGQVGALFESTQDSLASGDIEAFAAAAPEQAKQYDAAGRKIKAVDSCGDTKYGQLLVDLGDVLIEVGSKLGVVTEQSLLDNDGGGVAQVQEIGQLISGAGNQMEVIGEYITDATS